jgi:hypothetical protein
MGKMGKRKFQRGDKVRVVGIPKMTFAPGVKDELVLKLRARKPKGRP